MFEVSYIYIYSRLREKNQEERCSNFELCLSQSKEDVEDGEKANWSQCLRDFQKEALGKDMEFIASNFCCFNFGSKERKNSKGLCCGPFPTHTGPRIVLSFSAWNTTTWYFPWCEHEAFASRQNIAGNVVLAKEMIISWSEKDDLEKMIIACESWYGPYHQ